MRITLNLASQPYVDVRSILKRLRVVMLILALLVLPLWWLLHAKEGQAAAATARVQAVENNVQRLQHEQQSYQEMMQQPQNAAVLKQADFLNGLFRRKAFSWTATMTDLETVLPMGVQVLSIDPQVAKDGTVTIHMRVSGGRDRAIELVRNLEKSRHFVGPRVVAEAQAQIPGQNNPNAMAMQPVSASTLVNFDVLAAYRPIEGSAKQEHDAEKDAQSAASASAHTTAHAAAHTLHATAAAHGKQGAR
ncbi:fimbrial assembly protein [Silvibacterium sp.]|uniref:fimbrial assembly protein n=1 Tax=Silvibacterium sp. TaxID=1964179 RepID=UPI0039E322BA